MSVQRAPVDDTMCSSTEDSLIKSAKMMSVTDVDSASNDTPPPSSTTAAVTSAVTSASVKMPDEDSAYMTHPASVTSTPSSVSPLSWAGDWTSDDHAGQRAAGQQRVQRKSWAAGQSESDFHHLYQQHHLYQSESCHDMTSASDPAAAADQLVKPDATAMLSLFSSARRHLGRRRDVTADNDNNTARSNGVGTSGGGDVCQLHRAPSSLFYLEYNEADDDDDDDDALWRKSRRKYSDNMPSSRKISAAAYLPRVTSPSDDGAQPHQQPQHQQQPQRGDGGDEDVDKRQSPTPTFTKRRRRLQPQQLAVTTIDEILKRHDSSLQQYYKDTLRQVSLRLSLSLSLSLSVCLSVRIRVRITVETLSFVKFSLR